MIVKTKEEKHYQKLKEKHFVKMNKLTDSGVNKIIHNLEMLSDI